MAEEFIPKYLETGSLENFRGTIEKMVLEPSGGHNQNGSYTDTGDESVNATRCPEENTVNMTGTGNSGGGGPGGGPGGGNPGGDAVVVTTYQVCEYYLVTTTYDHYINGQYAYTDQISSIEVDCHDVTITEAEAAMDDTGCELLDDNIPILQPRLEDLINDSQLVLCHKGVLNQLRNNNTSWISNTVLGLFGTSKVFEVNLISINNQNTTNAGWTDYPFQYDPIKGIYSTNIYINTRYNTTDLSVAKTILHEFMHAYLMYEMKTNPSTLNMNYKDLVNTWTTMNDLNSAQHEEIKNYVQHIADALKGFDGGQQSNDFYYGLAWGGLQGTSGWNSLSQSDRTRYSNYINTELNNLSGAKGSLCK